jgi:hypothetical protein
MREKQHAQGRTPIAQGRTPIAQQGRGQLGEDR